MASTDRDLADAYAAHQRGDLVRATNLYKRVLRAAPNDADALNLLGLLHLHRDQAGDAISFLRRADQAAPGNAETQYNLGLALLATLDLPAARACFLASSKLAPDNPEPVVAAANVARKLDDQDVAKAAYQSILKIDPKHRGARVGMSLVCNDEGVAANVGRNPAVALAKFREAVDFDDQHAEAWLNLGIVGEQLGHLDEAATALIAALKINNSLVDAHFHLAHLRQHASTDDEIAAMITLFERSDRESDERVTLAYGIAKAKEKHRDYSEEFNWLLQAHTTQGTTGRFNEEQNRQEFTRLKSTYDANTLAGFDRGGGEGLIFIVGMPRSGTSLAEQILASHSEIYGAGELLAVAGHAVSPISDESTLQRAAVEIEGRLREQAGDARLVVETTPTNFLHIGRIAMLFPAARIVYCVRDPRDTCLSIFQQPLSDAHAYAHDLGSLGRYYRRVESLMDHWKSLIANPFFELRYERVVDAFEPSVLELLDFCGVSFEDSCLRFHETARQVKTPSASQVRQPVYSSSVGRWRRYENQLGELIDALG